MESEIKVKRKRVTKLSVVLASIGLVIMAGSGQAQDQTRPQTEYPPEAQAELQLDNRTAADESDSSMAQSRTPRLRAADLEAWLDGYMDSALQPSGIAGAVVSVVKDGKLLLSKGYGYADVESGRLMDPSRTLIRTGSTSKLFTWTAVMQMYEQGKLDLDRDVNTYLDFRIPERSDGPVTMNQLMTHRGGFEEGLKNVLMSDPEKLLTTEQYLKNHPRPRIFPAGEAPAYSNYGTALAGYIVERVSGQPFEDYIEQHILNPLGMRHSTFRQPLPEPFEDDMSRGYMSADQKPWKFELAVTAPAGSLSSTADDMANFMIAQLQNGQFENSRILQPGTAELMHRSEYPLPEGFATMAHGFFSGWENGHWVIGHGGDTVLFHTDLNLLPDENVGFFVSFNSRGSNDSVYSLRSRLFEDFMDRYFPGPEATVEAVAPTESLIPAEEIAGRYQSSRRIETAFLRLIYILQQTQLVANEDGSISFASRPKQRFIESGPGVWRDPESERALLVSRENGGLTIVDSGNPTAVLQTVPTVKNASLNGFILVASIVILILSLIAWPVAWWYRRKFRQPVALQGKPSLAQRLVRFAALADVVYLYGWYLAMQPLLQSKLDAYGSSFDGFLRLLQIGAILPIAAVLAGLWHAGLTVSSDRHWAAKLGSLVLAAAFLGILWIAFAGGLMSYNLEY